MKKLTIALLATFLTCAVFAQGFYIEMKITSGGKTDVGNMKVYAQDGNTRNEIHINGPTGSIDMVNLILKATPNSLYMLNEKGKYYSEVDLSKSAQYKDYPQEDYEVTVLGKEKVNGYNATHVKVTHKGGTVSEELWTSTDVTDYSTLVNTKSKFTGRDNLNKALAAKGAMGFPVRIKANEHGVDMQIDLVKTEKRSYPANFFSLEGYNKGTGAGAPGGGQSQQEMIQKLQNMTPEERQKYIDELKSQYGVQPK